VGKLKESFRCEKADYRLGCKSASRGRTRGPPLSL
jgi:hypothetical protein